MLINQEREALKNEDNNMMAKYEAEQMREANLYGYNGYYVKRHGQLDPMTHNNLNYKNSLSENKWIFKGANGFYSEKDMNPWHYNIN